jgi:hypothetical protein
MDIFIFIVSGVAGTFLMTTFVYCISMLTAQPFKVVKILGTMLTGETGSKGELSSSHRVLTVGLGAHCAIGILFALIFFVLIQYDFFSVTLMSSMAFAIIAGVVGVCVWRVYFLMHPRPPKIPLMGYLLTIFTGHLFFGLGMFLVIQLTVLFHI